MIIVSFIISILAKKKFCLYFKYNLPKKLCTDLKDNGNGKPD